MDLLIPFIDNDLSFLFGVFGSYGTYRLGKFTYNRRNPYAIRLAKNVSKGIIEVRVHKRTNKPWPMEATSHVATYRDPYGTTQTKLYAVAGKINAADADADEQVIETIVKAKSWVQEWQSDSQFKALEKVARNALKS
jgi:hypothetical protein